MNNMLRYILFFVFLTTPLFAMASVSSAGIPKDLMWFSKNPFYAGDNITVYTVVYNSTPYEFSGTMELRDETQVIGKQKFHVGPSGASEIVAIPWMVGLGDHNLSMVATNGIFTLSGKTVSNSEVTHVQSGQVELFTELPPAKVATVSADPLATSSSATASSSMISSLGVAVADHIPAPIVSTAVPVFGYLEQFRVAQASSALAIIHGAESNIISAGGDENALTATSSKTHLDKWGGVIDASTTAAALAKKRSDMKGWDLLLHGTSGADLVRTPWQYVKLFFSLIFSFIIDHAILFYVVLLLLIYKIVRILLGFFL